MKKILKVFGISFLVIVISAAAAVGLLELVRDRNVAATGNVLGVSWYNESEKEFTITTNKELVEFAELSNFYSFKGQTVKLGADIVLNEGNATDWETQAPSKRWKSISKFAGTFDGQGHSISGVYAKSYEVPMALFVNTDKECVIQNVKLLNSYFETRGQAGTACFVSQGGGTLKRLYTDATIRHSGANVGGIASALTEKADLEECWFDGTIHTTRQNCGGIIDAVDVSQVTLKHSLFSGNIYAKSLSDVSGKVGGLCGYVVKERRFVVSDCLSSGIIHSDDVTSTGSMVGFRDYNSFVSAQDVFVSKDVTDMVFGTSGARGTLTGNPIQTRETELLGTKAYQWTTLDFENYWAAIEDNTPVLKCFTEDALNLDGVQKAYDISWYQPGQFVFEIKTVEQLYGFSLISATTDFSGMRIKLGADIVVNTGNAKDWAKNAPEKPWYPISDFKGTFDGQGHIISGIYLDTSLQYQGLFTTVQQEASIRDFSLKNSYFCNHNESLAMMGSIAGEFRGKLDGVYSDAIVVSRGAQAGGLLARANDNDENGAKDSIVITNCWFDGEVHLKGDKTTYAGGILGAVIQGDVEVIHCLNTGLISSEAVKTGLQVGGLVGSVSHAKSQLILTDCLNAGEIKVAYDVAVGSAVGRIANEKNHSAVITNTYTLTDSYTTSVGTSGGKITGGVIQLDRSLLTGYNAYKFTDLDFAKYWAVVKTDTPILQKYASTVPSVAGIEKAVDTSWYQADAKEYIIKNLKELYGFASLASAMNFEGKTVKLGADITVNPVNEATLASWKSGTSAPENPWIHIGNYGTPFQGTFDGQGHTICGIYLKTDVQYTGMFGYVNPKGVIKNFSLKDSYFCSTNEKLSMMGCVVGELRGKLENVYSNAIIEAYGPQAGGMVARSNDNDNDGVKDSVVVKNCWFDGEAYLRGESNTYVGGIVGALIQGDLEMSHCLNTGLVSSEYNQATGAIHVGGLLGSVSHAKAQLVLTDSLSAGEIVVKKDLGTGAAIGRIANAKNHTATITNTYATAQSYVNAIGYSSGVINGGVIQLDEALLTGFKAYQYTDLDFAKNWAVVETDTPILKQFAMSIPSWAGIEKKVDTSWYKADAKEFTIHNLKELYGFASLATAIRFKGQTVKVDSDITVNAVDEKILASWKSGDAIPENPWICIGSENVPFEGTFDGQGHDINGVYLNTDVQYTGMFGFVNPEGVIKNFSLKDSCFCSTNDTLSMIGSIAGEIRGTIQNVYSSAVVVAYGPQAGGIVARANDNDDDGIKDATIIKNCWFDGEVLLKGVSNTYAGGIVAAVIQGDAEVSHCLNTGSVSTEKNTSGAVHVGGLIGSLSHKKAQLTLSDSLNVGSVYVKENYDLGSGSVIGRVANKEHTANITNTYTTVESHTSAIGYSTGNINGGAVQLTKELMSGYNAYKFTELDFMWNWAIVETDTPVLDYFATSDPSVDGLEKMVDISWYSEEEQEFEIDTVQKLYGVAILSISTDFEGKIIKLTQDISMNDVNDSILTSWKKGTGSAENTWVPIGSESKPFAGTFDGDGHIISGLYLKNTTGKTRQGLFAVAGETSKIYDFKLLDSYMESNANYLGIVGISYSKEIRDIYTNAIYVAKTGASYIGSIMGRWYGLNASFDDAKNVNKALPQYVQNCWFDGEIYLGDNVNIAGGLVGQTIMNGCFNLDNCLNTGAIYGTNNTKVGGIYAEDFSACVLNVNNCLAVGKMDIPNGSKLGGLLAGNDAWYSIVTVVKSYTTNAPFYAYETGGANTEFGKWNAADYVKERSYLLWTDEEVLFPKLAGEHANAWVNDEVANNTDRGTPILARFAEWWIKRQPVTNVITRPDTSWYDATKPEFTLTTAAQLMGLAQVVASDDTGLEGKTIKLGNDIQLNLVQEGTIESWKAGTVPENVWTPVGTSAKPFAGKFNGQRFAISGLYLSANTAGAGLFGHVSATCEIENLKLVDSYMTTTSTQLGLIGQGPLLRCENVYTNAIMVGNENTGGIIGRLNGQCSGYAEALNPNCTKKQTIKNCWFDGEIEVGPKDGQIGGFVGQTMGNMYLEMVSCLNSGSITGTNSSYVGGLVGYDNSNSTFKIENCLVVGSIIMPESTTVGSFVGAIICKFTTVPVTNSYTTGANAYGTNASNNVTWDKTAYTKTRDYLATTDIATLFPTANSWQKDSVNNGTDRGTPILKYFATWWIDRNSVTD